MCCFLAKLNMFTNFSVAHVTLMPLNSPSTCLKSRTSGPGLSLSWVRAATEAHTIRQMLAKLMSPFWKQRFILLITGRTYEMGQGNESISLNLA